ncbi:hypothetical protein B0H19DRAFT_1250693 [Mycena capillaripes]|nr:hypothetical protein B0H19DRAFT_1250693 [Mycena capillaripes]
MSVAKCLCDCPDEIIAEILLLVPRSFEWYPELYYASRREFAFLSRRFLQIVTSDSRFWSYIFLDERTRASTLAKIVELANDAPAILSIRTLPSYSLLLPIPFRSESISTTGPYPVHDAHWDAMFAILSLIVPNFRHFLLKTSTCTDTDHILRRVNTLHSKSISSINLDIEVRDLSIQRLSDRAHPQPFGGTMPTLRSLVMEDMFLIWSTPIFSNLTFLHIGTPGARGCIPTVDDLFTLLRAANRLVALGFINVVVQDFHQFTGYPPVMNYMTELAFTCCCTSSNCFLSTLGLPALRTLDMAINEGEVEELITDFTRHCTRLLGCITSIQIDVDLSMTSFLSLLAVLPNVERVDARPMKTLLHLHLHAVLLYWTDLCPKLDLICIDECIENRILDGMLTKSSETRPDVNLRIVSLVGIDTNGYVSIPYVSWMEDGIIRSKPSAFDLMDPYFLRAM